MKRFCWLGALLVTACGLDEQVLSRVGTEQSAGSAGMGGSAGSAGTTSTSAVRALDTTDYGTCAISDGTVWCWGGQADEPNPGPFESTPTQVPLSERATSLAAGATHVCALSESGSVYCWGANAKSQLGSSDASVTGPVSVPLVGKAREVQAGGEHSCAVADDGTLWCWGANSENQLGQADLSIVQSAEPLQVGSERDWHDLALGQGHSCGLRGSGTLWCWGRNNAAQLGLGFIEPGQVPPPTRVGTDSDWLTLAADQEGSCGIRSDHHVYCWGGNVGGRVGTPGTDDALSPTLIAAQDTFDSVDTHTFHSCATAQSGALYCWGRNIEGQLGLGTATTSEPPTALPNQAFSTIHVGRFHTCALDRAADVYCTGKNDTGQLGLGDTTRRDTLTQLSVP